MAMKDFQPEETLTASDLNVYCVNAIGAVKASNTSIASSTTLANDNHLFVTVLGNSYYELSGALKYTSASSVPGIKFQFTGPSGATLTWSTIGLAVGGTTQSDIATQPLSIGAAAQQATLGGSSQFVTFSGVLKTATTGGTFRLMFAQQASSSNQTTLEQDSYFVLRRFL